MHEQDGPKIVTEKRRLGIEFDGFRYVFGIEIDGCGKLRDGSFDFGLGEQGRSKGIMGLRIRSIEFDGGGELQFGRFEFAEVEKGATKIDASLQITGKGSNDGFQVGHSFTGSAELEQNSAKSELAIGGGRIES